MRSARLCLALTLLLFISTVHLPLGADLTIFDVRKNLAMSDNDPTYRDFMINGGTEAGLTTGMVLTVQRRIPLYDSYQNRSAGELQLKVAKIKIIHVQRGLAVARLHAEFTREGTPILEDNYLMVGDHVDISSASSDRGDKSEKKAEHSSEPSSHSGKSAAAVAAQIVVNAVELSSQAQSQSQPALKADPVKKVDVPVLQ